jgi:hypothetical protein
LLGTSIEEAEKHGVAVKVKTTTAWHSVLLFKIPQSLGSLVIWDPVKSTYKYPFIYNKDQGWFLYTHYFY